MADATIPFCASCGAPLTAAANFCDQCGTIRGGAIPPSPTPKTRWYHNVWFVLAMLFFVLGPFGLPLVWKNPRLSRAVKIGLTLAMILYTWWLIDLTVKMAQAIVGHVNQFNSALPSY